MWNNPDPELKLSAIIERNAYEDALNIHLEAIKEYLDTTRVQEIEREEFMDANWSDEATI